MYLLEVSNPVKAVDAHIIKRENELQIFVYSHVIYLLKVQLFGELTIDQQLTDILNQVGSLNFVDMLAVMASILLHLIKFK